jgi:hypothetical protein
MSEHTICIDAEALRCGLKTIGWQIMNAEPAAALSRIARLLDELEPEACCDHGAHREAENLEPGI